MDHLNCCVFLISHNRMFEAPKFSYDWGDLFITERDFVLWFWHAYTQLEGLTRTMAKRIDSESDLSEVDHYDEEEMNSEEVSDDDEQDEDEEDEMDEEEDYTEQTPLSSDNEDEDEEANNDEEDEEDDDDFELEEKPKKQAPIKKLKLKMTVRPSPLSKTIVNGEEQEEEEEEEEEEKIIDPAPKKRGRPKGSANKQAVKKTKKVKAESTRPKRQSKAVDYQDYDNFDEADDFNSGDDIIPTPALDEEGLSDDEEQYQPDVTKMTERQRARLLDDDNDTDGNDSKLVSLSNNTHKRRILTAEETELRKAEVARKRKNMLEKKLDEEKQDTINRLLKRRAVKTGTRSKKQVDDDNDLEGRRRERPRRPQLDHPALLRWVSRGNDLKLRVPEALLPTQE